MSTFQTYTVSSSDVGLPAPLPQRHLTVKAVRVKRGWLGLVWYGDKIVWESRPYKGERGAIHAADRARVKAMEGLFK